MNTVGLMAGCLLMPKVVHLALSLAVMMTSRWLTLKAHYWVLILIEMMAVKMERQLWLGIHLAGMLATVKQNDALTAHHLACWKVMAQSTHASLAMMMTGMMANQKLKDSGAGGYWGQHSLMMTEKALMWVHLLTMVIHMDQSLAGMKPVPKGSTMAGLMAL